MVNNKKNNIKTCIISFQIVILLILFIGCIEEDKMFFSTPDETFNDTSVYSQNSASSNLSEGNIQTDGLIISIPTEADLKSYISNQGIPLPLDISAYLFYRMDGIYLIFTDNTNVDKEITSAEVIGTFYSINLDVNEIPDELRSLQIKGVILADSVRLTEPVQAFVKEINRNPSNSAFKRVEIQGIYLVSSYKIGYAEYGIQKHLGNGILADEFPTDDKSMVIETLDPTHTTWQVRHGNIIATVLYPTDEILALFDYASPQGVEEVKHEVRPILLVEEIEQRTISDVSIQELTSNPYSYHGDVVKITGYALGENVPIKEILEQVNQNFRYVPVDVNVLGVGIADEPYIGSQIILGGLNSELISETEMIMGRYEFDVAVTIQNVDGQNVPMLFLIEKNELPLEVPTDIVDYIPTQSPTPLLDFGILYVASSPYGADIYIDGEFVGNTIAGYYQPLNVEAGSHTIRLTMPEYDDYLTTEYISPNQVTYLYPSLTDVTPTYTPETGYIYIWSNPAGASIYVDGNYEGTTDSTQYTIVSSTTGSHTVEIAIDGYEDYSTSVYVYSGQYAIVDAYLTLTSTPTPTATPTPTPTPTVTQDIGYIYVWSSPAGGSIYVDGNYKGTTDGSQYTIVSTTTDSHTVEIAKDGYEDYSTSVYVYSGQYAIVDAYLTPTSTPTPTATPTPYGYMGVASDPPLSSIYIDGHYKGVTLDGSLQVFVASVGRHRVVLRNGDLYWESNSVDVDEPNKRYDVIVTRPMWW